MLILLRVLHEVELRNLGLERGTRKKGRKGSRSGNGKRGGMSDVGERGVVLERRGGVGERDGGAWRERDRREGSR